MKKLKKLEEFVYTANQNGYAAGAKKVTPQRPGFKEIEYREGDWYFRDSYAGHFFAPGQKTVYFKNKPAWCISFSGGMKFRYHNNEKLADETFTFLKQALLKMPKSKPFRGPKSFKLDDWLYKNTVKGDIKDFSGIEKIYFKEKLVFEQNFIGGIIVD